MADVDDKDRGTAKPKIARSVLRPSEEPETLRVFVWTAVSALIHLTIGVVVAAVAFVVIFFVALQLERGLHYCVAAQLVEAGSPMYYTAFCAKYFLLASDLVTLGAFVYGFTRIATKRFLK